MNTIGIDISKEWVDCLCSRRQQNRRFTNNHSGWKTLKDWIIDEEPHVIMEASGPYYLGLASYLYEQGLTVSVVNPLVIRRYGQMKLTRTKTDAKDAGLIAQYGIDQQPDPWVPPSKARQSLKKLMSMREGLLRQKSILSGQAEAFNQNREIEPMVNALNGKMQKEIENNIIRIDRRMETLAEKHYQQVMEALLTIPGIGKKTAIELVTVTDGFGRFDSARALASYVGICPRIWESGSSVKGRGSISKLGCPQLRKLLYMCSWSAKRSNPACRKMYNRLKKRGKPEKVIKVAIAHKLLRQAFAVGSSREPFTVKKALAA
jgi:transposase